jgi:hypothetical protein
MLNPVPVFLINAFSCKRNTMVISVFTTFSFDQKESVILSFCANPEAINLQSLSIVKITKNNKLSINATDAI